METRAPRPDYANGRKRSAPPSPLPTKPTTSTERSPLLRSSHSLTKPHHRRRRLLPLLLLTIFVLFTLYLLLPYVLPSPLLTLLSSLTSLSSCTTCLGLLYPLKTLARMGDGPFVSVLTTVCSGLGIQDREVCEGALGSQAPTIAHALRSIELSGRTADLFCANVFGLCKQPEIVPWKVPMKKAKTGHGHGKGGAAKKWKSKGRKPMKVVHLSDLHVDWEYEEGSEVVCSRNMCCRKYNEDSVGENVQVPAPKFGHRRCDSPPALLRSMLDAVDKFAPDAAFSLFTGDSVDHAVWSVTQDTVTQSVNSAHAELAKHLKTVYGVIGNHDMAPVNALPRNTTSTSVSSQWVFDIHSTDYLTHSWLPLASSLAMRALSGCYSVVHPGTKLRIISLNGGYWYKENFWLYDSDKFQPDPNGILQWLASELEMAEEKGERAWLVGHLSSGKTDFLREQSRYFGQVIERFQDTIAGQFYGHTHRDEFEISYSDYRNRTSETAMSISYIGPALVPASGNPAFRVYSVDPDTYEVLDIDTYMANMSDPTFQDQPTWKHFYSAKQHYGPMVDSVRKRHREAKKKNVAITITDVETGEDVDDDDELSNPHHDSAMAKFAPLDAAFYHDLTTHFIDYPDALSAYMSRRFRDRDVSPDSGSAGAAARSLRERCVWDKTCRDRMICTLRAGRSEDNCDWVSAGLHISGVSGEHKHGEEGEEDGEEEAELWRWLLDGGEGGDEDGSEAREPPPSGWKAVLGSWWKSIASSTASIAPFDPNEKGQAQEPLSREERASRPLTPEQAMRLYKVVDMADDVGCTNHAHGSGSILRGFVGWARNRRREREQIAVAEQLGVAGVHVKKERKYGIPQSMVDEMSQSLRRASRRQKSIPEHVVRWAVDNVVTRWPLRLFFRPPRWSDDVDA